MGEGDVCLTLLVVLGLCASGHGYPSGAPDKACDDMVPQHGVDPQTTPSPYTLHVSSDTLKDGNTLTVTVSSSTNSSFKGFLVRAIDTSMSRTEYVNGQFYDLTDESQITCADNDGVTHTSKNEKTSVSFEWKPKASLKTNMLFVATVVQEFSHFWVNITSTTVEVDYTAPTGPSTEPNNPTTGPSGLSTTSGPGPSKPQCEAGRGCFQAGCQNGDCDAVVMWNRVHDYVLFDIVSTLKVGENRWTAIGFSDDGKMSGTSVIMCRFEEMVNVELGYNQGYSYSAVQIQKTQENQDLTAVSGSVVDGVEKCSFKRRINSTSEADKIFSLDQEYYLLLGTGPIIGGVPNQHEDIPFKSTVKVDFLANSKLNGDITSPVFVKIHGALMVLAWILCSSIGIVVARYLKEDWPNTKPFGIRFWFHIHRTLMSTVFLASAASMVLIFVKLGGYVSIIPPSDREYVSKHPILGITVMSLATINPIMAFFRVAPDHPHRPIFNWSHRIVGTSAHIISGVTIYFGLNLPKANTPDTASYVMIAYAVTYTLIEFVYGVYWQCTKASPEMERYAKDLADFGINEGEEIKNKSDQFRMTLLALHVICMIGFASTLIYFIVTS